MADTADPAPSWPAWKFGMKRSDITKLHDQYNTISTPIQDQESFNYDVYALATRAKNKDEFHALMAERKEQRIEELNSSLDAASLNIISNPDLIHKEKWALAVQLFREHSLDALVRYFSSYLPDSHWDSDAETLDDHSVDSDMSRRSTATVSTQVTDLNLAEGSFFPEKVAMNEPLPMSPGNSVDSITDVESASIPTPASRSMSFSSSEMDCRPHSNDIAPSFDDYHCGVANKHIGEHCETPVDTAVISASQDVTNISSCDDAKASHTTCTTSATTAVSVTTILSPLESETPTPRASSTCSSSVSPLAKPSPQLRRSPSRQSRSTKARPAQRSPRTSPRLHKRELNPQTSRPSMERLWRIQKPMWDHIRSRPERSRGVV